MNSPRILVRFLIALGLLFASHGFAQADSPFDNQLVVISCDPGSQVDIWYDDVDGQESGQVKKDDVVRDGKVEFTVPNGVTSVRVLKWSEGRTLQYTVKLKGGTAGARSLRGSE